MDGFNSLMLPLRIWPDSTWTRPRWCGTGMLFQDRTLWRSFLSHCHQVNSKFTQLIVSLFTVSVVKSLKCYIFFIHVLWTSGLKWAWWILGIEFKYVMQSKICKFCSFFDRASNPRPNHSACCNWWDSEVWREQTALLQPELPFDSSGYAQQWSTCLEDCQWLLQVSRLE